eukprot:12145-Hanusia_phi.AAC.1
MPMPHGEEIGLPSCRGPLFLCLVSQQLRFSTESWPSEASWLSTAPMVQPARDRSTSIGDA